MKTMAQAARKITILGATGSIGASTLEQPLPLPVRRQRSHREAVGPARPIASLADALEADRAGRALARQLLGRQTLTA